MFRRNGAVRSAYPSDLTTNCVVWCRPFSSTQRTVCQPTEGSQKTMSDATAELTSLPSRNQKSLALGLGDVAWKATFWKEGGKSFMMMKVLLSTGDAMTGAASRLTVMHSARCSGGNTRPG